MDEKNITIEYAISIRDSGYSWRATGGARVELDMPLSLVELIDPGNIFQGALKSAILDYHESVLKAEQEENEEESND